MIEGLKVTVKGAELRDLCKKRAEYHRKRARAYANHRVKLEADGIELTNVSSDPKRVMADRCRSHESDARELEFIADHLNKKETYLLDRSDLHKIGVCQTEY